MPIADIPDQDAIIAEYEQELFQVEDRETDWMLLAACRGTEPLMWFPDDYHNTCETQEGRGNADPFRRRLLAAARSVCQACPVQPDCLAYALRYKEPWGIWGGLTAREREELA